MICLTLAPVAAPVGLPFGVGAQPWVGDGAILVGTPADAYGVLLDAAVGVLLGDAVGVSEGELDEVSGTVLGSGPAAGAGLCGGAAAEHSHTQQRGGSARFPDRLDCHRVPSLRQFVSGRRQRVIRLCSGAPLCQPGLETNPRSTGQCLQTTNRGGSTARPRRQVTR